MAFERRQAGTVRGPPWSEFPMLGLHPTLVPQAGDNLYSAWAVFERQKQKTQSRIQLGPHVSQRPFYRPRAIRVHSRHLRADAFLHQRTQPAARSEHESGSALKGQYPRGAAFPSRVDLKVAPNLTSFVSRVCAGYASDRGVLRTSMLVSALACERPKLSDFCYSQDGNH